MALLARVGWRRSPSIRRQLLLLVLALGIPFVLVLLLAAVRQADSDRAQAGQRMLAAASVAAARLDDHVGDIQQVLAVLGAVVGSTAADARNNQVLLLNLVPRLPAQVGQVGVWNAQGDSIVALEPGMPGGTAPQPLVRRALAMPGLTVDAPVWLPDAGTKAVALFALHFERNGVPAGVVTLASELQGLQSLLTADSALPPDAVVAVTQERAIVLARSLEPERWIGRDLHGAVPNIDQMQRERRGVRDGRGVDGLARIAGFATAQRVPWLVYVGLPATTALAPVQRHLLQSVAGGAALLAAGLLLSAWMARRISTPLQQLCLDAQTLARGDLQHRSAVQVGGEVGELAATLNQMADALDQRNALLQSSEAELTDLYDNAPCGFHSLDAEGNLLRINNTALRLLGYDRRELLGRPLDDLLTTEGRALHAEKLPLLQQHAYLKDLQFDLVCKSGDKRRVVASANAVFDADGRYLHCRAAWHDITELQALRGDVLRLEDEQRAMLDTQLIGFMKLQKRRIAWVNPGITALLGHAPGDLLGRSTRMLYPDAAAYDDLGARTYPLISAGRPARNQIQLRHRNGDVVWFDKLALPLPHEPDAAMVVLVDLSPVKEAEEARMRALALQAENRQLIESNRVKAQFLANMSHELHTPLNAVLGYTHLLRSGKTRPDSPKFASFLDQIDTSGRQLLALVDAMLTLARLDAGKLEFAPEPVQLRRLLADALQLLHTDALARHIDVTLQVDDAVNAVVVDPLRLTQVVVIYLSNAIKFSANGSTVEVRALHAPASMPGGAACFRVEVQDHGIGIGDEDLPRLFRAFQQLSEGMSRAYTGAGLGLALACQLVQGQGGQVAVHSKLGLGSTFSLTLPLRPQPKSQADGTAPGTDAAASAV